LSFTKRLDDARSGYKNKDLTLSAKAHDTARISAVAQEQHGGASHAYLGNMVYGGLDGIVTTFAVVSGVAGASLGANVVLIMGLANLFADGFSMGIGAYLQTKSDQEYYDRERQREAWEVVHFPDGEKAELQAVYETKGYTHEEAGKLIEIQTKDPEIWVDTMMVHELGLMRDEKKPLSAALTTILAFVAAGSLPLLVYLIGLATPIPPSTAFFISLGLSFAALFGLGAAKVLVTGLNPLRSGLEMLLVGGLASGVAYAIGLLLKGLGV
jgi:VIT1/CCC1 family predicted Fe2+/Mn2+ transporter